MSAMSPRAIHCGHDLATSPASSSWINQVDRFFALLSEQEIKRGVHRSTAEVEARSTPISEPVTPIPKPFRCTKSANDILGSIERFCRRTIGECLDDIPNTNPPMISAEQERRDKNQDIAIAYYIWNKCHGRTKDDFLASGNKRNTEHSVDQIEPAA